VGKREDRADQTKAVTILAAPTDRCSCEPVRGDPTREDRPTILTAHTHWHWHLQKPVGGALMMELRLIVLGKREDRSDQTKAVTFLAAPTDRCSCEPVRGDPTREDRLTILTAPTHWH
jgi:hypothetical protein